MMVVVDELTVRCLLEARRPLVRVQVSEAGGLLPHVMHLVVIFIMSAMAMAMAMMMTMTNHFFQLCRNEGNLTV